MKIFLILLGLVIIALGAVLFYLIWWITVPYVTSTIPAGEWHKLIEVGIYILAVVTVGISAPVALVLGGFKVMFSEGD